MGNARRHGLSDALGRNEIAVVGHQYGFGGAFARSATLDVARIAAAQRREAAIESRRT